VVVGAGSAGFSAAITAAEQGAQVSLVGHGTIGGTCVKFESKTTIFFSRIACYEICRAPT
jgi:pyruvate/2-oxoglutarate dehydrogenase complex dihydrolipoamide dehydrogenase (E3) component